MASVASDMRPTRVREVIGRALDQLAVHFSPDGNDRLHSLWQGWKTQLEDLRTQLDATPTISISLLGDSGAGKSTLVNALTCCGLLPVSDRQACTSAVTQIAYAEREFTADVEFLSKESWDQEVALLLKDIRDSHHGEEKSSALFGPGAEILRAARDKLSSVYRPLEDADKRDFDPRHLVLPPEIEEALAAGRFTVRHSDLKAFRKDVNQYLSSAHRFWPIVKQVSIRGPFAMLADGATLVDLPGMNDPNEAREAVTREHLKTCHFVWVVFNMKRSLTRAALEIMESDDFVRQIIMDGRSDSLTFVGTHADDVDLQAFDDDERDPLDVIQSRNQEVRKIIRNQLCELSGRLASRANDYLATAEQIGRQLVDSKVFTVSAREYLRLNGLDKHHSAGIERQDDTEIPALCTHLHNLCQGFGMPAHTEIILRQLRLLFSEIAAETQQQRSILKTRVAVSQHEREEMRTVVTTARTFLERDLHEAQDRLVSDLEHSRQLLAERVERAVERARRDLDSVLMSWGQLHHATLKAVCNRGGVFNRKGDQNGHDFPGDTAEPILDGIEFAWTEFFAEKLKLQLEKWRDRLQKRADNFRGTLLGDIRQRFAMHPDIPASLETVFKANEQVLQEQLMVLVQQLEGRIRRDQRTLYERVPQQIRINMRPAFAQSSVEVGPGMKSRILAILSRHARQVSQVMFDEAEESLLDGVRGLNDWLSQESMAMIGSVRKSAEVAAENVLSTGLPTHGGSAEQQLCALDHLAELTVGLATTV